MDDIKVLVSRDIKFMVAFFIFIVCDMITGVIGAGLEGNLKSSEFRKGLMKKCLEIILILVGYSFDVVMGLDEIGLAVVMFEIAMEGYSILENISKYVPLPDALVKVLNSLQKKEEPKEEPKQESNFLPRTEAPTIDDDTYYWPSSSAKQCTWYAYYRCLEAFGLYPCWRTGSGSTGGQGFADAKNWPIHYRDPFKFIDKINTPAKAGDIAVFNGNYGHVVFIEKVENNMITFTDYNKVSPKTFSCQTMDYVTFTNYNGNNSLMGYLRK